jgi:hypothetical protein
VGNIDYSGYVGIGSWASPSTGIINAEGTLINASGVTGAGSIVGSQGGTTIFDNSGVNAMDLTHSGSNGNLVLLDEVQKGVTDSGSAITASQSALDSISGWTANDAIILHTDGFTTTGVAVSAVGNGTIDPGSGTAISFSTFLTNAETSIDGHDYAAYYADVGGATYLALNNGSDHVGEIVEIMGVHTLTLNGVGYIV